MRAQRAALAAGLAAIAACLAWLLFIGLPRWYGTPAPTIAARPEPRPVASPGRKIKARLFYVADEGTALAGVESDVPYADGTVEQAKEIARAQIAPVADLLVSAVPPGTTLRGLFITAKGEAYVDLSGELASAHPGGSLNEMLTIYTLVDALTVNLPAVSAVQILIDGKEVETLAGHVDLRRPLAQNLSWIQQGEALVASR